ILCLTECPNIEQRPSTSGTVAKANKFAIDLQFLSIHSDIQHSMLSRRQAARSPFAHWPLTSSGQFAVGHFDSKIRFLRNFPVLRAQGALQFSSVQQSLARCLQQPHYRAITVLLPCLTCT